MSPFLHLSLVWLGLLSTGALFCSDILYDQPLPLNMHLSAGYRKDNLKLQLATKEGFPHTRSEVKWRNLNITQVAAAFDYSTLNNYYCRINGDYGTITSGSGAVQNSFELSPSPGLSNSLGPNSRLPSSSASTSHFAKTFSRQKAKVDEGCVADLSGAIGWKVISEGGRCWIAAAGGYSCHMQKIDLDHFKQTCDLWNFIGKGPLETMEGHYQTRWYGPWLGVDFFSLVQCDITLFASAEWHWAHFRGDGRWHYRDDGFKTNFKNKAIAYGATGTLGVDWEIAEQWALGVTGNYQLWSTRKGSNSGKARSLSQVNNPIQITTPLVKKAHLRRVKWNSFSISGLLSHRF